LVTEQIEQLAARARQLTALGQLEAARQHWVAVLTLLPVDAPERPGVLREIERIDARLAPQPAISWTKRLGPLGVLVAFLAKFKAFFGLLGFVGLYWTMFGWSFAVGLTGSVFIHEMGHFLMVRRFGFKAELPMFIPGFGAFVAWRGSNVDPGVRAQISLAGPLFGFFSGLLAYGIFLSTHQSVWLAVAQFAGWLNLINLLPVSLLDGNSALNAVGARHRVIITAVCVILGLIIHEWTFLIVAAGVAYRLWRRDFPAQSKPGIAPAFLGLAIANGLLDWFCTNQVRFLFSHPGI
jgi:Zn-dependent protease